MDFIVDVQGFKKPIDEFVLKEFAVIEVKSDKAAQPLTLLFQPPCAWSALPAKYKSMNSWLQRNYHGMDWTSGDIPYEAAGTIIRSILKHARTIFVKGLEKKRWLARLMEISSESIVDLETLDCPSLRKLQTISPVIGCSHHSNTPKYSCADANVKSLKNWLNLYQTVCENEIL